MLRGGRQEQVIDEREPVSTWNRVAFSADGSRLAWAFSDGSLSMYRLPSGERLEANGCDLWGFSKGKITKKDTYYKQIVS